MPAVTVVGGGLAGMVTALRLLERDYQVTLYEANDRLGGKAGANRTGPFYDDHGYHIFPAWYRNTWTIVDELGIRKNFVDCSDFLQVRVGEFPQYKTLRNLTSARWALFNLKSGVSSLHDMFLFLYAALDLISQRYSNKAMLDQITVTGFVRSRFYRTPGIMDEMQDLMLKGITVPSYLVSAMTMHKVMQFWIKDPLPMYRILRGNLQQLWIEPLEQRLLARGCVIEKGQRLEKLEITDGRVRSLRLRDVEANKTRDVVVERVVLAIPAERVAALIDDDLYEAAPDLARVRGLRAQPMAALNLYFDRRYPTIPKAHTNLLGSAFGLSFIDISQTWPQLGATVLNMIASDFTSLETVSEGEAIYQLVAELRRFMPIIDPGHIVRAYLQPHLDAPLFRNDVGAWQFRPDARTQLPNLYLAGDYCRSSIDLVSMEAAITTGLGAAEAIRQDVGLGGRIPIAEPAVYPDWLMILAKVCLLPVAFVAKAVALRDEWRQKRQPGEAQN